MGRLKKAVGYKKVGKIWYYKTSAMTTYKTTGETSKALAERYVMRLLKQGMAGKANPMFKDYAEPYFDWDRCPHVTRLKSEGKPIGKRYCYVQRGYLEKYVFCSPLGSKSIADIKKGDLLDFRAGLQKRGVTGNNINSIMKAIKVVFSEAVYREDLPYNPASGIGTVVTGNKESGIFTEDELNRLFANPNDSLLWRTPADYVCFLIAATTGMRSAEVLALRWCNVDFSNRVIHIREAWKDNNHTVSGLPKSYKMRDVIMPLILSEALQSYHKVSVFNASGDLVVCDDYGKPFTVSHWQKSFRLALKGIGITEDIRIARHLKPHSFRHTLNTIMREKGMNPDIIRLMLGWTDAGIQNNYTHFDIARMIRQGDLVDEIFSSSKALPSL